MRGVCLPPFGIWIDPIYRGSELGEKIAVHERVHWHQFVDRPLTYYPRHLWHILRNTPPQRNPLEVEAFEVSGVW